MKFLSNILEFCTYLVSDVIVVVVGPQEIVEALHLVVDGDGDPEAGVELGPGPLHPHGVFVHLMAKGQLLLPLLHVLAVVLVVTLELEAFHVGEDGLDGDGSVGRAGAGETALLVQNHLRK